MRLARRGGRGVLALFAVLGGGTRSLAIRRGVRGPSGFLAGGDARFCFLRCQHLSPSCGGHFVGLIFLYLLKCP